MVCFDNSAVLCNYPVYLQGSKNCGGGKLLLIAIVLCELFAKVVPAFTGAWIFSYFFGFVLGREKATDPQKQHFDHIWSKFGYVCVITLIVNFIKIYLLYVSDVKLGHAGRVFLSRFYNYCHVCLAVTVFMGLNIIGERIVVGQTMKKMLQLSDRYSYDVYLVHHIFLIGPFSLLKLGEVKGLIVFCIVVPILSIMLQRAGRFFAGMIFSLK